MSDDYDEDYDDPPSRKRTQRRRGSARMGDARERPDVLNSIMQETLASCAPVRQGQIYPVLAGNNGLHLEETIAEALWAAGGKRSIAAGWLGIALRNLEHRIRESEKLQEVEYEIEQLGLDVTETQLDLLINAGVDKAIIFKLKTKGKRRGWGDNKDTSPKESLTLDAARELESKLVSAFESFRKAAVDAVVTSKPEPAQEQPAIEAKAVEVIETQAESEEFTGGSLD